MLLMKSILSCWTLLAVAFWTIGVEPSCCFAQAADDGPIYLEEPEEEPPARVSRRKTVKEVYADKSVRAEREVAMLSDNTEVSDGKYTEYYSDGQKYVEGNYKLGVFEGEWSYLHPNGQLCKTISFKAGKPEGEWEIFDKNGKRTAQKSYQGGKRQGKWVFYFENGEKPKIEVNYNQGQIDGQRNTFYENGQKRQEIHFKNGKMHGTMTEWTESGEKRAEALFDEGKMDGKAIQFDNIPGIGEKEVGSLSSELK